MPGELILYTTTDGAARIQLRAESGSVWLTQLEMAELFATTKQNVSLHIQNILKERELPEEATVKESLTVQTEGGREVKRSTKLYRLEMILAVGYRVRSHRGTQFRQWATRHLRDYLVKGFVLDDDRFKQAGGGGYFEELLARIRDIRSSEKVFWRKVLDIYATSVDYDPRAEASQRFFATVQNKMHWAAHGHTAAEVIHGRADAAKPHMGLLSFQGARPRRGDVAIAKNYLNAGEIEPLNRIVTLYLEFAELQAGQRKPMTMGDWIAKLDQFLQISDRPVLDHAGKVTAEEARAKAEAEYERFRKLLDLEPSPAEKHYLEATGQLPPALGDNENLKALDDAAKTLAKAKGKRKGGKA
ncbi:MAG: virulence RhuM family protein [Verrucomicrobiales bacterium]|nr:virulence RhuM family protein [Verrucomicrobiales bacterium]